MTTTETHSAIGTTERATTGPATAGLGDIAVQRDALQARARAEAFLFTIRAMRRGIDAVRMRRGRH